MTKSDREPPFPAKPGSMSVFTRIRAHSLRPSLLMRLHGRSQRFRTFTASFHAAVAPTETIVKLDGFMGKFYSDNDFLGG